MVSFQPLLFGGDINVYSVARAFHEAYGVKSIAYGYYPSGPAYGSDIIDYRTCPSIQDLEDIFDTFCVPYRCTTEFVDIHFNCFYMAKLEIKFRNTDTEEN